MPVDAPPPHVVDGAQQMVREALGNDTRVAAARLLGHRPHYWVLALDLAPRSRRVVLKLSGPQAEHPVDFDRTAAVVSLVREAGVPTPAVLATGRAGHRRWQLLEHVEGTPWRLVHADLSPGERYEAHRQIADVLLRVQSVRFDGFGEIDVTGGPAASSAWVAALHERAAARVPDRRHREAFHAVVDREADLLSDAGLPTLCHDDLQHDNILVARDGDRWRLAAILDWDKAWSASAQVDVARMTFWDGMTGPAFWEVYRSAVPERDGDDQRTLVHQLLWCLEYVVDTPRHRADTTRVAEQLGIRLD